MAQHYKLRLGDGTVLSVDQDGLRTWAADGAAMVQIVGSWRWQPLHQVLAEEETAARLARALVPPTPTRQAPAPSQVEPASPRLAESAFGGLSFGEPAFTETPAPEARPALQSLADDPVHARASEPEPLGVADEMPSIRVKPLDDEPVYPAAWTEKKLGEELGEDEIEDEPRYEAPRYERLEGPLLTVLETLGGFLSRCLAPLTPLAARVSERMTSARSTSPEMASERVTTERREVYRPREDYVQPREDYVEPTRVARKSTASSGSSPRILSLADETDARRGFGDEPEYAADEPGLLARVSGRVSGWLSGIGARLRRQDHGRADHGRPDPDEAPAPMREPARSSPTSFAPERQPLRPPPSLNELPRLRFVEQHEEPEPADLYEGDEPSTAGYYAQVVWLWTKRLLITGALVAGVGYAALEREAWFPRAADIGQRLFDQVDGWLSGRKEQQRVALADAVERLPALAPASIRLIFSRSTTGMMEVGEVFQTAREAADRGLATLTPAESQELQALEQELLSKLSRREAEAVREYDRTRVRRVIFPFENAPVMNLVAVGARGLPLERRQRLQALSHKAVAAGLDLPEARGATSTAR